MGSSCGAPCTWSTREVLSNVVCRGFCNSMPFQCKDIRDLNNHVGQWMAQRNRFGQGLDDAHLREMFINILPGAVKELIRERHDFMDLNQRMAFVKKSCHHAQ